MKIIRGSLLMTFCLLLTLFLVACSGPNTTGGQTTGNTMNNKNMGNGNMDAQNMDNKNMDNGNMNGQNMDNKNMDNKNMDNGNMNGQNMDKGNMNGQNMDNKNMDNGNMNGQNMDKNAMGNGVMIKTKSVMINGKNVMVLTNEKGFLLYYKRSDPAPDSTCTGDCAKEWPPVLAQDMNAVKSEMMLPKKLTIHKTANGNQVLYDGHPLYLYTGDTMAGQFKGRGMDNDWFLAGIQL